MVRPENERHLFFNVDVSVAKRFRYLCVGLDVQRKTLFTAMLKYVEEKQDDFEKWLENRKNK